MVSFQTNEECGTKNLVVRISSVEILAVRSGNGASGATKDSKTITVIGIYGVAVKVKINIVCKVEHLELTPIFIVAL